LTIDTLGQGEMGHLRETGTNLDDNVRDAHLAAQGRQEHDELNGVDVIGDGNQGGLLRLDEGDDMVQTVLDDTRLKQQD
jgi:hypothetical protein